MTRKDDDDDERNQKKMKYIFNLKYYNLHLEIR